MTKVDIISGFLGAGKTTLIKKLLAEVFEGQKIVLIENEFGQIGIDGGFLKESGIEITEMNQGCICCSLVGDFGKSLKEVMEKFAPDRIVIEPSGVGKLSDVIKAVLNEKENIDIELATYTAVIDAQKCKMYSKNFGEFYNNQIESAKAIILSRTQNVDQKKLDEVIEIIKEKNDKAVIITTPWDEISGAQIFSAMEHENDFTLELMKEEHHHHHHDHDDDCDCGCHDHDHEHHHDHDHEHDHDHDHGPDCECGCHDHEHHDHDHEHHHDHDEDCDCGCHDHDHEHEHHDHDHEHHHEHEHDHGPDCTCGCHDHDHDHHHHHHDADEVFASWGKEVYKAYTKEQIKDILDALSNEEEYGIILRAKGIVKGDGEWIHFDMVPGEADIRSGAADVCGRLCVIGSKIDEAKIAALFEV